MRIAIVGGAGGVGASVAFNLIRDAPGHEVLLVDRRPEMVTSHAMDLEQVTAFEGGGTVIEAALGDIASADIIVVTAGAPLTLNTSRNVFLQSNAEIVGTVLDVIPDGWPGSLVLVTNPVDPLLTWAQQRTGIARERLLGYTFNDSLRLRSGIATQLGVHPADVDAWVIGEHGDGCVPLWSRVQVGGRPVVLTDEQRAGADAFLRTWYRRHVALDSGRTSTWTSGLGVARMVIAMIDDSGETWPASIVLDGEYGVSGVAVSVPVELGLGGALSVLQWDLAAEEASRFEESVGLVREATATIPA